MAKKRWIQDLQAAADETAENINAIAEAREDDIRQLLNEGDVELIENSITRALALTRTLKKLYAN